MPNNTAPELSPYHYDRIARLLDAQTQQVVDELLASGVDLEAPDKEGCTVLMCAVKEGRIGMVKALLQAGANIEARDPDGNTPLMEAIARRDLPMVSALLDEGVNIDARNNNCTALIFATYSGEVAMMRMLHSAGADIDAACATGLTPLLMAAYEGHLDMLNALLEAGANANARAEGGATAMMLAAGKGKVPMLNALVLAGLDIQATADGGVTALMVAAQEGQSAAVGVLLAAGARIDAVDNEGSSALLSAACAQAWACMDILRLHGAKMHAANYVGETPEQTIRAVFKDIDVNAPLPGGLTRLMDAAKNGFWTLMETLIAAGAHVDAVNGEGDTALMFAARGGQWAAMDMLRDQGADMHAPNHDGVTPFAAALQTLEKSGDVGLADNGTAFATVRLLLEQDHWTHMELLFAMVAGIEAIDHRAQTAPQEVCDLAVGTAGSRDPVGADDAGYSNIIAGQEGRHDAPAVAFCGVPAD
ncbi:ankyrin repeat domain-containing protein [Pantoea sp. 18069]|uniref:ankyrin repeat domain-containing protein n=1 Tax=Pantoea sp. 18069 TaxID=2681415 RepID=UPI001357AB6A|nr:ankyrin repeat domain-containing protein [Pantoea sp. 18069]